MTRSWWILLFCTSVQPILYQFACGTDGVDSVLTQWNTTLRKPATALADTILATIIPPAKILRLPWSQGKTDSVGGTSLTQVLGGKAKHRDAFELPDDPIKEAVWRAATSLLSLPKSAVSTPASSTLQSTRRLRQETTTLCATTPCRSGVHPGDAALSGEVVPVQELSFLDQVKGSLASEGGRSETLHMSSRATKENKTLALQQRTFRLLTDSTGEQVTDVPASSNLRATGRTSSSVNDSIIARSYIVNFARKVGTQYGDPEKYGDCAADFVDEYLSPAELTVQLAQLMMEVDSRDKLAGKKTAHHRTVDGSEPLPGIQSSVSLSENTKEKKDESTHLLSRLSHISGTPRRLHTGLTKNDPAPVTEPEVESRSFPDLVSGKLGVRLNSGFITATRSLQSPAVHLQSLPTQQGEDQMESDTSHEKLRRSYHTDILTKEAARFTIISFAGEIGSQKGAPEEHVRLAKAFIDRYLEPAGWTQYIAELIMEARRESGIANLA